MALAQHHLIRGPWRSRQPYPRVPAWSYLEEAARRAPDGLAIVDGDGQPTTFGQLWGYSLAVARYLQQHGDVSAGQTVAVGSQGGRDAAAALFGALLAGARVSPLGISLKSHDAAYQLEDCGAVYALAPEPLLGTIRALLADGSLPGLRGLVPFSSILELAQSDRRPPDPVPVDPDRDIALLPYSSGSSGLPKGVMISHSGLNAATRQQLATSGLQRGARVLNLRLPWTRLHLTIAAGATYLAPDGSEADSIAWQIERHRPTHLLVKPSTLRSIVQEQRRHSRDLACLECIETGAEALAPGLQREATELLGCPVFQAYHQTETCGSSNRAPLGGSRPGAVGWPVPDTEERIVDLSTDADVPVGHEGELLIRGPQVMLGYLDRPAETDACLSADGWLHTGDLARQDTDGQIVIVDRIKDLIKVRGAPIAPAEIEQVLSQHPSVSEVAVASVASGQDGERAAAFVVLEPNAHVSPAELMALAAGQLAAYKVPNAVYFVASLPRGPNGKVRRRELTRTDVDGAGLSWSEVLSQETASEPRP
jgi:acyl-CoA synthetase (AMP-forming)/AMP-acid ligase II